MLSEQFIMYLPGEPNGPVWLGPLYCGVDELGGAPGKLDPWGGAGPGVDDPEGAGEAVYCGVFDPGGPASVAGLPWPSGKTVEKFFFFKPIYTTKNRRNIHHLKL